MSLLVYMAETNNMSLKNKLDEAEQFVDVCSSIVRQKSSSPLEATIQNMADTHICGHPTHYHSFQQIAVLFSSATCAGCEERVQPVTALLKRIGNNQNSLVKCIACGAIAHRACAMNDQKWKRMCPINGPQILNGSLKHPEEEQEDEEETIEFVHDEHNIKVAISANDHLHHTSHPFASVARALQENVLAHMNRQQQEQQQELPVEPKYERVSTEETQQDEKNQPILAQWASGAVQAARTSIQRLPAGAPVVVAGGIAGGVAGLVMAGPAGAYAGAKLGQVAGALGILAEGSVTVGVVVASVATASITAQQLQEQWNGRHHVLTMGEEGTSRKVLLVRPNIQIDPVWEEIVAEARQSAPKQPPKVAWPLQRSNGHLERYRRDSDIVQTAEDEIPTEEKVLLLVSRILSDKTSIPGHVYRQLLQSFQKRCDERVRQAAHDILYETPVRARRDDAHAVIKHVAGALLEVRPELASSPALTELTATAVEGLVFGQIYPLVWEEVVAETTIRDAALATQANARTETITLSQTALNALRMLPDTHTAVDKLHVCVRFLELISEQLSGANVGADALLRLVCHHLLHYAAEEESRIHAQVAFLEEFARDEQLLRGREGYALVTLQAACHFLLSNEADVMNDVITETELDDSILLLSLEDTDGDAREASANAATSEDENENDAPSG